MMAPLSLNVRVIFGPTILQPTVFGETRRLPTPASTSEAGARVASAAQNALHGRESRAQGNPNPRVNTPPACPSTEARGRGTINF